MNEVQLLLLVVGKKFNCVGRDVYHVGLGPHVASEQVHGEECADGHEQVFWRTYCVAESLPELNRRGLLEHRLQPGSEDGVVLVVVWVRRVVRTSAGDSGDWRWEVGRDSRPIPLA